MEEKEEIEKLAIEYCKSIKNTCEDGDVFSGFIAGYTKCQNEKEQIICVSCNKPIQINDINKHLFMKVQGGLIHWKC